MKTDVIYRELIIRHGYGTIIGREDIRQVILHFIPDNFANEFLGELDALMTHALITDLGNKEIYGGCQIFRIRHPCELSENLQAVRQKSLGRNGN